MTFSRCSKTTQKTLNINYSNYSNYNYGDYITKYLTELKDINDDKYDMLTHKNVKFLFNQFNNHVTQINEPVKYRKHIEIVDEDFALCVLQEENLPYFIE